MSAFFQRSTSEKLENDRGEQALLEPAWNPVKSINKEELLIWRIEGSEVKQVEDSEYGIFFDDAIYILLKAANKQRKICYDLHFWIPHSMVKYIAAEPPAKVMELSALLHDRVIYHKEIEYFESSIVKHYFKTFIVLHDGVDTAFNENDPRAYKPRLLLFKLNRSRGELRQVPASKKALNSHCVFVLDTGREMLQWNGSSCSDEERSAASKHINNFLGRRKGKLIREFYDEEDLLSFNPFTSLLSDEPVDPLPNPPKAFEKALLRLSDDSGALKLIPVCRGRISHAGLEPTDVNFVDTIDGLFIYVGPTASKREREGAWSEARKYLSNMQRPYMSVHFLKAGQKSYEFDEIWDDYE
ncbi:unnamed protein product [Mesocestoides corti]|uniref:Gelsolin-like domain-containing protein n=1 Tax=Mesocestoides corti TaxID=53468 RepID=A0A0R3U2S8_MESCO|nr:unnamed protein product [Mesocestoides corti]